MSLVYLTKEEEIKKAESTSSAICITFIIVATLAIIGLIYYGATAAYWGTVVDKYVIEKRGCGGV